MKGKLLSRFSEVQNIAHTLATKQSTGDVLSSLLTGARRVSGADGGTIYLLGSDNQLHFTVMQNETLKISHVEPSEKSTSFIPIPLYDKEGNPNQENLAARAAIENNSSNIPDVYAAEGIHTSGIRAFDEQMNYRTQSLLTIPIHNQTWGVIGVLQLINSVNKDSGQAEPFSEADLLLAEALAFQAGTNITNARINAESEKLLDRVTRLNQIGISLSSQESTEQLLKEIVISAKALTFADAGTLYLHKDNKLHFEVMQTDSLDIHLSSADGNLSNIEPIPLYDMRGNPNDRLVAASAALHGSTINIPDVYQADGYNFTGTRAFDRKNGYRSQSFLTVPMHNQKKELIGVLQLINAISPDSGKITSFSEEDQQLAESFASQAAVALTNKRLNEELQLLLESFIDVISKSIDEKSPYTGGHCRRVTELAMMTARAASETDSGPLAGFRLSKEEMYEMKIAAMLHDCGKITTPVHIVDKSTKLETIHDRIDLLDLRHELIRRDMMIEKLQQQVAEPDSVLESLQEPLSKLQEDMAFIHQSNMGGEFMAPERQQRIHNIAAEYSWQDASGKIHPFITDDEAYNLNVAKGTLTDEEREIINFHIVSTIRMLEALPFPQHLQHVPEIAGGHHERMDGKGYPNGLTRDQMSVQARILGVADIFEALTASDRPYKPGMPLSRALSILETMKGEGHIDPDLFDLFIDKKIYLSYGHRFLDKQQVDIDAYHPKGDGNQ
ncbi:HD-GYP domain, c-di-GMP phosphodiesterase class II (or its inactivated variant) [Mariprofundus ferrinatatus]|uniref:HD-GYP domain, c-di-GMP phosphodiesterase class II (Or its inactivated variant) n=1 Tax=Mariprofundus ferrinatatus TaxID=1921087 RepID=A0A2K8LB28_9PROT|nr:HD family phosphohydrolase [Mariprofundus ferrinatatus]ATX82134.1 HD-GYP domain, c-di-GMP phosphodiesterase class II (or its inactivated variant) [Mariprofundus ferrinatatus]